MPTPIRSRDLTLLPLLALIACGGSGSGNADLTMAPTPDASSTGSAITGLPDDQWTWVDFPTALCAGGTPTGIAVNPHAGATSLVLYLQGGGACSDAAGCWGPTPRATYLTGYDATTFGGKPPGLPVLNRATAGNPFAAMNLVYVPYCTGDMHAGTVMTTLTYGGNAIPTYFYGGRDMDLFLERLVPTFPTTSRVWVVGSSAGGYGTFLNAGRVASAFGVGVDVVDDSGPPLVPKGSITNDNAGLLGIWGTVAGLPSGCAGCKSFREILDFDLTLQQSFSPPGRFAFMSFDEDTTIAPDFGYDPMTEYPGLMSTFSASLAGNTSFATFLVSNYPSHVVQSDLKLAPFYLPWLTLMVNRDPSWADATHVGGM